MSMEEGLFPKDHTCKHASETPHIKGVVVHLQIIKHYYTGSMVMLYYAHKLILPNPYCVQTSQTHPVYSHILEGYHLHQIKPFFSFFS